MERVRDSRSREVEMGIYADRLWLALYDKDLPSELEQEFDNALDMFAAAAARAADQPLLHYFGSTLTLRQVDEASDALAVAFVELGVAPGDRVGLCLQNVPQFPIAMLAAWKTGAIVVPVNPMLKQRELLFVLADSGAKVLVTLESLYRNIAAEAVPPSVGAVITTSELDFLGDETPSLLAAVRRHAARGTRDVLQLVEHHRGRRPEPVSLRPDDVAFLTYTSGTTGPPKAAMNTHGNVVFNAQTYRSWMHLQSGDVVLGVAPLFHITGLIAHLAVSLLIPVPCVLGYRFDPGTTLDLIERYRASFTVASITVFIALMNHPTARERDFSSLTKLYSGGAPVPSTLVEAWESLTGGYIHNIYGLTETTSPSHAVPLRQRAPVNPKFGVLSVGVPTFNTIVRVADERGEDVPVGEVGELVISGPQVVPGYWQKPEETQNALPDGALRTGDVGFMDERGWFYIVDRKKDIINAGGYKVWPREVEDVLYRHPAVREAAVVGVPDDYRGETVKAFVSLQPGQTADEAALIAFCEQHLAAYKYPRQVEVVDELPKTVTGKVLRRELWERGHTAAAERSH